MKFTVAGSEVGVSYGCVLYGGYSIYMITFTTWWKAYKYLRI